MSDLDENEEMMLGVRDLMAGNIDYKLRLIIEDVQESEDRILGRGEQTYVEQIKQVFKDAGYMQGHEWFGRFFYEYRKKRQFLASRAIFAAQKATGLDEDDRAKRASGIVK